ncbi:Hermansky-Pudlak syndrome 1 protein homolog [Centruroides sculpturatus]|uniref:Hermansky-Pudlak syndrome 1 protein homolog n=1 Tax=Centruroides sculpturatus TaxID=218467 RepID=UPI000C6CC17F|nr:Hermansky-Pudlak syndrome 1 protein homolog [Centruroides sculpturatus]
MKKFFENSKKIKLEQLLERRVKNLMSKWEQLKRNNFLEFLHNSNELLMPARLETAITAICEDIQTMFELIVFEPEILHQIKPDNAIICALLQVQEISSSKLMDYIDYLVVKAQQNISMTSYIQDFPGLIHFIYVDRTRNYIVTPSVRISEHYTEGNNMTNITKRLIWKMVDFSYEYLESNHLSAMWREENYCFSYFLWFEDANGKILKPAETKSKYQLLPGILCGDFYELLIKNFFPNMSPKNINCYELYSMHLAQVPMTTISDQARRLSLSAWEMSGIAHIPIDLL